MKNNEDLPRVHAPTHLPSTNLPTATNEILEVTNPRNVTDVGEPATLKTGNEENSVSGDKVIIALKPGNEDNSVSKDKAASDIFDSDAESLPNLDSEDETEEWFEDKTTRIAFIQKVLAIKLLQLLGITGVTVLVFVNRWSLGINDFLNNANMTHLVVLCIFAFIVTNVVSFGFLFGRNVEEARRKNPFRYMFLTIYPLRISALIVICTLYWYLTTSVLIIMIYYCVVVFILFMYSILSCQTNLDFTFKYSAIVAVSTQVILCTVTAPFAFPIYLFWYIPMSTYLTILCASLILILEYVYIVYVIAAITSKNYWRKTPADFIDGAINLQMDYYHVIRSIFIDVSRRCGFLEVCDSYVPKIRDKSKKIKNRVVEALRSTSLYDKKLPLQHC